MGHLGKKGGGGGSGVILVTSQYEKRLGGTSEFV